MLIHRFRGLQLLELPGLGQINLLVGANDSGKTSVLEALALYSRPLDPLWWLSTTKRRDPAGHQERVSTHDRLEPWLSTEVITPYDHWLKMGPVRSVSHALLGGLRSEILELLRAFDSRITDLEIAAPMGTPLIYLEDTSAGLVPCDSRCR